MDVNAPLRTEKAMCPRSTLMGHSYPELDMNILDIFIKIPQISSTCFN